MAFPPGVSTAAVSLGVVGNFAGGTADIELTVRPDVPGLIHTASGARFLDTPITVTGRDEVVITALPHTDQPGFQDRAGNPVTNWGYVGTGVFTDRAGNRSRFRLSFPLPVGETVVDLDLVGQDNGGGVVSNSDHLGWRDKTQERKTLVLSRGVADFIHTLTPETGAAFPEGFTAKIMLYASSAAADQAPGSPLITWAPVSVSATRLVWNVQHGTVDGPDAAIAAGAGWHRLYANFPAVPTDDYLWYFGPVEYRG